jgi:hypothetical protein
MPAIQLSRAVAAAVALAALAAIGVAMYRGSDADEGGAFPDKDHEFGEVVQGKLVEHAFTVRNSTDRDLFVRRVSGLGGVAVTKVDSVVGPGRTGRIHLRFDTRNRRGAVLELANVYTADDSIRPAATLRLRGVVVLPLQLSPQDRVYFFTATGQPERHDVEVINHHTRPLKILSVTSDNPVFAAAHRTVDDGKRYRISVTLDPRTPVGRHQGRIVVRTDNPAYASVPILASAFVDERISTTPKRIDFSTIPLEAVNRPVIGDKQVLVKKYGGTDFRVLRVSTDLPFLDATAKPHKDGESVMVTVRIQKPRARRGPIRGTLTIETNDPAFPRLKVPITGNLV